MANFFYFYFFRGWSDGLPWLERGSYCHSRPKTQMKLLRAAWQTFFHEVQHSLESCRSTITCHTSCFKKYRTEKRRPTRHWDQTNEVLSLSRNRPCQHFNVGKGFNIRLECCKLHHQIFQRRCFVLQTNPVQFLMLIKNLLPRLLL